MYRTLIIGWAILTVSLVGTSFRKKDERFRKDQNWPGLVRLLNQFDAASAGKLKFDGLYFLIDTMPSLNHSIQTKYPSHLAFFSNGIIRVSESVTVDSHQLAWLYTTAFDRGNLPGRSYGAYAITDDTIDCYFYKMLGLHGAKARMFLVHYSGIIVGKDTIADWHMVPPYPTAPAKYNGDFYYSRRSKRYVHQSVPAKALAKTDSIWLLKYRTR
jgi:hypothetical protein